MMTARAVAVAAVLAHAVPALADFEGIADLRMTGQDEGHSVSGTGRIWLSPVGWRTEIDLKLERSAAAAGAQGMPASQVHRVVAIGKAASPGKTWLLNEQTKTYHVMDGGAERRGPREEGWKITKLGKDTVAGFSCTRIKAERPGHDEVEEACMAKDFVSDALLKSAKEGREWWVGAARKAGYPGSPMRVVTRGADGSEKHRMEIVKVERRAVPASTFEVPAGYREGTMMDVQAQTPEQRRQLQELQRQAAERMKDMSPEQRKMMEEMMKKYGAGQE